MPARRRDQKKPVCHIYHCTGNRGKCPEPYTRQELLSEAFVSILRELVIPQPVLEWLGDALLESDRAEHAAREQSIKLLQARHDQIQSRIETMYMDKLDGGLPRNSSTGPRPRKWDEQQVLLRKIRTIQAAATTPIDQAVDYVAAN